MSEVIRTDVVLVGAGPIGIEMAAALKRAGIDYVHLEKGAVGQTMFWWPNGTQWFSSNDRIGIAGIPLVTPDQQKATREEYLTYLRTVVRTFDLKINTFEAVTKINREGDGFLITTRSAGGEQRYRCDKLILATGGTAKPNLCNIPGEDLPHVTHVMDDPHKYFMKKLLVVGGKNSAVEGALRAHHAGASVTMSVRHVKFDPRHVKYWLLPELMGRIGRDEIACHYDTEPVKITPTHVTLKHVGSRETLDMEADFVLLATGFVADMSLFEMAGVELAGERRVPMFDEKTMQTNVAHCYVAGTAAAGTQQSYQVFLENCHVHVGRIIAALTGTEPPAEPRVQVDPEA